MTDSRFGRLRIARSRLVDLIGNLTNETRRREGLGERSEAQNPALKRSVEADVERHANPTVRGGFDPLRAVPFARPNVTGHVGVKFDFDALGLTRMHPKRVRERLVRQTLVR